MTIDGHSVLRLFFPLLTISCNYLEPSEYHFEVVHESLGFLGDQVVFDGPGPWAIGFICRPCRFLKSSKLP
jgi:hypothetical protein